MKLKGIHLNSRLFKGNAHTRIQEKGTRLRKGGKQKRLKKEPNSEIIETLYEHGEIPELSPLGPTNYP